MTVRERPKSRALTHPAPRKRAPRYSPQGQRDTIVIRQFPQGEFDAYHQDADLALVETQALALNAEDPQEFEIVRRPIGHGREAVLYRVVREEDGSVSTHVIDLED